MAHSGMGILVFLGLAAFGAPALARMFGLPVQLSFLMLGVSFAAWWHDLPELLENSEQIAKAGIMFMMFALGLELSAPKLLSMKKQLAAGGLQMATTAAGIGVFSWAWSGSLPLGAAVGLAFAMSSTAVAQSVLGKGGRVATPEGRAAFGILLAQDLAVAPILAYCATLVGGGGGAGWPAIIYGGAALAFCVIGGHFVLKPLTDSLAAGESGAEHVLAAGLFAAIGMGAATELAGLSDTLGAFLAGVALSETAARKELESMMHPARDLFLGAVFFSAGLSVDPFAGWRSWALAAGLAVGLVAAKTLIAYPVLRWSSDKRAGWEVSALVGQGGEFAFVVLALLAAGGALAKADAGLMILVGGLSMALTFPAAALGRFADRKRKARAALSAKSGPATGSEDEESPDAIVVGLGRFGSACSMALAGSGLSVLGLDEDVLAVKRARKEGIRAWKGSGLNWRMLDICGGQGARFGVVAVNSHASALESVKLLRKLNPQMIIGARARGEPEQAELLKAGADFCETETGQSALLLSKDVLERAGMPSEAADEALKAYRLRKSRFGLGKAWEAGQKESGARLSEKVSEAKRRPPMDEDAKELNALRLRALKEALDAEIAKQEEGASEKILRGGPMAEIGMAEKQACDMARSVLDACDRFADADRWLEAAELRLEELSESWRRSAEAQSESALEVAIKLSEALSDASLLFDPGPR